jgi:hypothetical protein
MDDAVRVFPNPAGSSVTITVDDYMAGYTMHIYDLSGRLVKQQVIESATYSFSIAGLAGGQYIYALSNKDGNQVYKNKLSVIK